ncbi:hypothetical protein D5H78_17745 [Vallicoccus soli]|uniref:Penicillin-binding protein n=1 Tax=Vallicoccus soli TaxID=2339232 RepID=A0A3A3YT65_9ACTN|nr:hypothetical protein D5H78_17745 [Vallicoccus soli]
MLAAGLALLLLAGCTGDDGASPEPSEDGALAAATAYLEAWTGSPDDPAAAAALTDDPAAAGALLEEVAGTLRVDGLEAEVTGASTGAPPATPAARAQGDAAGATPPGTPAPDPEGLRAVPFRAALELRSLGTWTYDGTVLVRPEGDGWTVHADPRTVHPALTEGTRLARLRELPARAPVLDARGRPLMQVRPVVEVGVQPQRASDRAALRRLASEVLEVDADALEERLAEADPLQVVPVITLREEAYREVEQQVRDVPGTIASPGERTLAPTPDFGRGVLGTVRPATAETLAEAGPYASEVDDVGTTGLQRAYQERLAGRPGGSVRLVAREDGEPVRVLHRFRAEPGRPLGTTLDLDVQAAAEAALGGRAGGVVVVRPSTGAVLAAASGPADGPDRALAGQYPPGSTFKVVTTTALLQRGLDPDDVVACPGEAVVEGKAFTNVDGFALGDVPFRTDFAESCNTAFVGLAEDLPAGALPGAAALYGLGVEGPAGVASGLGLGAYAGSVPAQPEPLGRAAASIGQGTVLASPLAMASVAATVADGTYRRPSLVTGDAAPAAVPPRPLDPGLARTLRGLMRGVVTGGSGGALADLPGPPAIAKTGTAEYGTEVPPRTHAWIVAAQGDLAVAVVLEDGGSGGRDAGPVAADLLRRLR